MGWHGKVGAYSEVGSVAHGENEDMGQAQHQLVSPVEQTLYTEVPAIQGTQSSILHPLPSSPPT